MRRTLGNGPVTNGRIAMFGLTGGLVPCPASITVLMVCLQLKQVALGSVLVLCFGIGLALTLVASGVIAALGVRHATRMFGPMEGLGARAPYLSGALMLLVSGYMLLLAMCESGKQQLDGFKRFDMPGFKPPPEYLREMQRYQILPPGFDPANDPIDVHALDRAYWDGFRYRPPTR